MRPLAAALFVPFALAACSPGTPAVTPQDVPVAEAPSCSVEVEGLPLYSLGEGYTAGAAAAGDDCSAATVVLTLHDPGGNIIYVFDANSSYLLGFADAAEIDTLQVALEAWAGDALTGEPSTTASLPAWPDGEDLPYQGEFPFYVEDDIDRAAYEAIRAAATPMYCHVQGVESMACLSVEASGVRKIGAQALPG